MPLVTIFYGLYGSGKSEISINYAIKMKERSHGRVVIVDLDAVTPYFRVRDVARELAQRGVMVLSPKDAPKFSDLPVLPQGVRGVFGNAQDNVIVDVGGDPTGARVLGGLKDVLPCDARALFVVNFLRPFSKTPQEAQKAMERVGDTSSVRPTGIVINNHLGNLTDVSHIRKGYQLGLELQQLTGLKIAFLAIPSWLKPQEETISEFTDGKDVLWLERFLTTPWETPNN